jgi:hypothetical protein
VDVDPKDYKVAWDYSIPREVTGSFTFTHDSPTWAELIGDAIAGRELTLYVEHKWSRWQRFLNWFARVYFWPIGPYPLPAGYEWTVPNAKIERINRDIERGIISVDWRADANN